MADKRDELQGRIKDLERLLREARTAGIAGRWIVARLQDVADFFGVQRDTVRKDWRDDGMPGEEGRYKLDEIARWKFDRLKAALQNAAPTDLEEKKLHEEWRYKWLKNELTERNLVPRDAVVQEAAMVMQRIADRLQALPDELESELPGDVRVEVKRRMQERVTLVLKEMSEWTFS
jgi:hypothetical protein